MYQESGPHVHNDYCVNLGSYGIASQLTSLSIRYAKDGKSCVSGFLAVLIFNQARRVKMEGVGLRVWRDEGCHERRVRVRNTKGFRDPGTIPTNCLVHNIVVIVWLLAYRIIN